MLSGLPGTGKGNWLSQHWPEPPMVSLDGLGAGLGVRPADDQGEVIQAARQRAREHLRNRPPFVRNATDLTQRPGLQNQTSIEEPNIPVWWAHRSQCVFP